MINVMWYIMPQIYLSIHYRPLMHLLINMKWKTIVIIIITAIKKHTYGQIYGPKTWVAVVNQVEHLLTGRLAVRFPAPLGYMWSVFGWNAEPRLASRLTGKSKSLLPGSANSSSHWSSKVGTLLRYSTNLPAYFRFIQTHEHLCREVILSGNRNTWELKDKR